MSRRKKRRKSRKRLAYIVIAVTFLLICSATYFYLNQSNQTPSNNNSHEILKAAIVDHLSLTKPNQTFIQTATNLLKTVNFTVDYYPGENVTVGFYKNLVSRNYGLIVFRVHSAIIGNGPELGLFTSEVLDESKYNTPSAPYYNDVLNKRIVNASFPEDPIYYFAIAPKFVEKYGTFRNTTIIMMGCDGLKYNTMAEAFRRKGVKVCIGWNGLVSHHHTDHATTRLLQHLVQGNTVEEAVDKTMDEVGPEKNYVSDQGYESILIYYPEDAGSYTIQFILGISGMETLRTNTFLVKEETRLNWL